METLYSTLCFMGALLFMLGLLTGAGIPNFRSPRIGLSAHLAAIESGLGLIAFGLLFPHLAISAGWVGAIGHTLWISLYLLWIGLVFAAVYGTGKVLPDRRRRNGGESVAGKHRAQPDHDWLDRQRRRSPGAAHPVALGRLTPGVRMPQCCAYFMAPFSQAWNVRLRSLSNDSLAAVLMISATEIEARALRHCVSASRKAFAIDSAACMRRARPRTALADEFRYTEMPAPTLQWPK